MSEPINVESEVTTDQPKQSQALTLRPSQEVAPSGLFGTQEPIAIIEKATGVATALKSVITKQGLISRIKDKEYPKCEAWTLLGTMLGVFPVLCWSKPVPGGWEARVEARTRDGAIVGAAEAQCLRAERNWKDRDDFALRSMAQTRATAKCLRMPLGFVMTLAGYEPTPAEEMVLDHPTHQNAPQSTGQSHPPVTGTTLPKQQEAPKAAESTPKEPVYATEEGKAKMISMLCGPDGANRGDVTEYFIQAGLLLPNEVLEDLPLMWVPATQGQMRALTQKIGDFIHSGTAERAFPANQIPPAAKKAKEAKPVEVPRDNPESQPSTPDPEVDWFMEVICPVPRKGMKRDVYLKNPDTIGSLYDARHGNDDESAVCRQRLWGFCHGFEAKGWTNAQGQVMPPSAADIKFKEALEAFKVFFEKTHPGEKL